MVKIKQIAKTCYEVNKAYCESIGDHSQLPWKKSPLWQRKSIIDGVNFHLNHPKAKPLDSHNNWLKGKKADGWVFGEVKDIKKKEHPCMVAYEKLPKEQQTKDALFISVVRSFLKY